MLDTSIVKLISQVITLLVQVLTFLWDFI
ncbi:hypothetical protein LINPERHAP1_LOCUS10345 [Linum perenne]